MMGVIKLLIQYVIHVQDLYAGSGMMMALYFVSLFIIAFYCRDARLYKTIILPSVILLTIIYIGLPVVNVLGGYTEIIAGRLFWVLITPIVTAIGLTVFVCNISEKWKRAVALVLMIPMFLYCGEFKLSDAFFTAVENEYRLPQTTVDITEYITTKTENPRLIVPYTIAHPFRQISTDVYLLFGEDASYGRITWAPDSLIETCRQMEMTTPDLNYIIPVAEFYDTDYILFDTVYTEFCENGNINVNGYPADKTYVGDRTPTVSFDDLPGITVVEDESGIYWDLSGYGLEYEATFGQYILYRFL